jgi:hypothetical protein
MMNTKFSVRALLSVFLSAEYGAVGIANLLGIILLLWQINPGDWTKESKFVSICLSMVIVIVGIYNANTEKNHDRLLLSGSLSCICLALMVAVGTIWLH